MRVRTAAVAGAVAVALFAGAFALGRAQRSEPAAAVAAARPARPLVALVVDRPRITGIKLEGGLRLPALKVEKKHRKSRRPTSASNTGPAPTVAPAPSPTVPQATVTAAPTAVPTGAPTSAPTSPPTPKPTAPPIDQQ